jgi:hypothetical protein
MVACPNCEATEQTEEETLSGSFGPDKQHSWSIQLLVEALEKALALGRAPDADRIVRRATAQVEEMLVAGAELDDAQLASLAIAASKASIASDDPTWGAWLADVYRRASRVPPAPVVDALTDLAEKFGPDMKAPVLGLADHLRGTARATTTDDAESIARVEHLRRLLSGPLGAGEPRGPADGESGSPTSNPTLS